MPKKSKEQQSPLVSVVVPAFNVSAFIKQSVRSALNQTLSDLEVIVIDDGSNDSTGKVIEDISDNRLRMFRKPNGGCASARNVGFAVSRGKFIAFLDGDDYWFANKLERQLALFEKHPDADLIFSLSCLVDENDRKEGIQKPGVYRTYTFQDLLIENPVGNGSAAVFRRRALELAGPFDESLPACSDYDMWLRIVKIRPDNFICLPEVLIYYRRRSGQTTSNWRRMRKAYQQVLNKIRLEDQQTVDRVEHQLLCHRNRYLAFIAYEEGKLKRAYWLFRESMNASKRTFFLDSRSWLLGCALFSKAFLPGGVDTALLRFFFTIRQNLFRCQKISRYRPY